MLDHIKLITDIRHSVFPSIHPLLDSLLCVRSPLGLWVHSPQSKFDRHLHLRPEHDTTKQCGQPSHLLLVHDSLLSYHPLITWLWLLSLFSSSPRRGKVAATIAFQVCAYIHV